MLTRHRIWTLICSWLWGWAIYWLSAAGAANAGMNDEEIQSLLAEHRLDREVRRGVYDLARYLDRQETWR